MSNEELEEALDIIVESLCKSNLHNYTKLELMINIKTFFEHYEDNIKLLRRNKNEKEKKV